MLKLGVNIDHVATLRQARYRGLPGGEPCPVEAARICLETGAHGITAHLREDRRHILDDDIVALRRVVTTRFNLEIANVPEIIDIAVRVKPDIVCLVPERREEITTEGGLDVVAAESSLVECRRRLNDAGIEVSLFIGPDAAQIEASSRIGAQFIELHTGPYAHAFHSKRERIVEIERLVTASRLAHGLGLRVNAGHGLNVENVPILHVVPHLEELNIGHSLISRAVFKGLAASVKEMLQAMEGYRG
jgi:pyridoxine 5-phosphate synthase